MGTRWSGGARIFMKTNCRWPYHITDMRRVNHRNNNLFDDCSVWWLQQVRPTPPSSSPTCSQTILPPTATPRFEFNKWPNHSTRDYVASKNWNFPSGADSHWPFNAPCPVIFLFIERFCHPLPEIPLFLFHFRLVVVAPILMLNDDAPVTVSD